MNKIFQILQWVARPVRAEFLFFVMVFLLLVQQPAEWLCLPSSNREWLTGKFLLAMGIEVGVAYFLTWLAWVSRCRVVKWLLLLLCWLLMGITLFLVTNFEMAISQQTLTVLVETTPNESAEFVATYMWSGESILSYLIDLAVAIAIVLLLVLEKRIKRALAPALLRPWVEGMVAMVVLAGVGMGVWAYGWLGYCSNSSRVYRWRHQFPPASLDIFTQSMQALNSLRAFDNDVKMALEQARKVQETHPTIEEPDSLTLFYVLESPISSIMLASMAIRSTPPHGSMPSVNVATCLCLTMWLLKKISLRLSRKTPLASIVWPMVSRGLKLPISPPFSSAVAMMCICGTFSAILWPTSYSP